MPYQKTNRKSYTSQFKFDRASDQELGGLKKQIAKLEQMVGKKEVELNLLIRQRRTDFYESRSSP